VPSNPGLGPNALFAPTLPVKFGLGDVSNCAPVVFERRYVGADAVDMPVLVGLNGLGEYPVEFGLSGRAE
jgi:hypothetical protein